MASNAASARHVALGLQGEDRAASYLAGLGYDILARNKRYPFGEIDIVARDGDALVVVEVKAGKTGQYGLALERVGPRKRQKLRLLAQRLWQEHRNDTVRIDLINVDAAGEIIHVKSAVEYDGE